MAAPFLDANASLGACRGGLKWLSRRLCRHKRAQNLAERIFKMPPSELKRFVLRAELDTVRGWITMLDAETDETLRAHRADLIACVEAAAAVASRAEADSRNTAIRGVGAYADYVRRVQEAREQVWSELERRRTHDTKNELPRDWPSRFFRRRPSQVSEEEKAARAAEKEREPQSPRILAEKAD